MPNALKSLRLAISCLIAQLAFAAITPALQAQVADIGKGRMNLAYEEAWAAQLRSVGVDFKFHGYREDPKHAGFRTAAGTLDLLTAQGEIQTRGGIHYTEGSMELDTDLLALELDGTSLGVTALVKENGVSIGRHRIYDLIGPLPLPLPLLYGAFDSGTIHFAMDPRFWAKFSTFFQIPQLIPGPTSGELHVMTSLDVPPL